jgi:glycosyltransferase involved in cell wall biosynthesis
MGHHADVVTYSFSRKSDFRRMQELLVREYTYKGISVTAVRHNRIPISIDTDTEDAAILQFACQFLHQGGYDLVHIVHPMRLTSFIAAAVELRIPYVLTLTDFWILCPKINLQSSFGTLCCGPEAGQACAELCPELPKELVKERMKAASKILQASKAVVVPSRFAASMVEKEFTQVPITVISHGVKLTQFKSNPRTYDGESRIVFGYCGGLSAHKGVHTLLNAFRSLETENAELRVYGAASSKEKDYEQALRRIAAEDQRIKFCGTYNEEDLGDVLECIDVLVIPSLVYETYSFVLHEAFAANVPVIASPIGVLAEKVRDSVTGLTFGLGSEADLASKLLRVIENPSIVRKMKENLSNQVPPLQEEETYLYERIYQNSSTQN